jgi:hypothetical protein
MKSQRLNEEINAPRSAWSAKTVSSWVSSRLRQALANGRRGRSWIWWKSRPRPSRLSAGSWIRQVQVPGSKKQHEAKLKQKQIQVKEVKFRPGTDENDYQIKLRNLSVSWARATRRR